MDPIGSDDEVIRARRTISKGHVDLAILLTQHCHGCAEPNRDANGALEQNAMKLTAGDAHAEADAAPELCQLDFCQLSSRVIQDSLMGHTDGSSKHRIRKPKRPESANAVPGEVQAGAVRWPRRRTLDDFRNDTLLSQCSAECETRDSAADNQDASRRHSRSNSLLRLTPCFLEFRGSRQNSAPRAHVWRYGVWLGGLRFSEKPSTQTQLAIDG